jgi:hypothetical protein
VTVAPIAGVLDQLETVEARMAGVRPEEWASDPVALAGASVRALGIAQELADTLDAVSHRPVG